MAILYPTYSTIGQSGQIPTFIFLKTNDSVGTVTTAGYLNQQVAQGSPISTTQMALVTTQTSSGAQPITGLYTISHTGGNWTLTQYGSSGGGFNPSASYDGISNPAITGNYLYQGGWIVNAGTGDATLQSDQGAVNLLAPNAGQFVNLTAANVAIAASTAATVTAPSITLTSSGVTAINATDEVSIEGSAVLFPGLNSLVTSNSVYYNNTSGALSFGPAGGGSFNPATPQTITGAWAMNGGFSVTSATGNVPVVATAGNISLTASSGNITLNSPIVELPSINSSVTENVLYYNFSNGAVTFGEFSSFSTSASYTLTGNWQFNAGFNVTSPTGDVSIQATAGSLNLLAPASGKAVNIQSPVVTVNASSAFTVSAGSSSYQTTGSGALSIAAGGVLSLQGAGGINIPTITSGIAADILYYNPSTGFVSAAAAPSSGGITWINKTSSPVTMAVSNGYITNDTSGQISYILPTTAAVGQIVEVVGNSSGGWVITQNAAQNIQIGSVTSTVGTGGSVTSDNEFDCISLICTVANTTFVSKSVIGQPLIA